jgi:phospholipid/cholesterol/gamma-HCH transport system substrate-binding protein
VKMRKIPAETVVGIFVVIGLLSVGYMTLKLGKLEVIGGNYYDLKAHFSTITGLKPGAPVTMLGIQIGQVKGLTMDQEDQVAIVDMKIKSDIKIYQDAIATIKTSGLIGDRYINIDAGGAEDIMRPGTVIRDTVPPVDIEDLISKFVFGGIK